MRQLAYTGWTIHSFVKIVISYHIHTFILVYSEEPTFVLKIILYAFMPSMIFIHLQTKLYSVIMLF